MDCQVHEKPVEQGKEPKGHANDDPAQPDVQPQAIENPSAQNTNDDDEDDDIDVAYDFIMQPRATLNPTSDHDDQDTKDMEDDVSLVHKVFSRKCICERRSKKKNHSNS
ncbi:hypothetical protein ACH5RR_039514 [Cinchona calisaya]|uniref:Uncharacterized protein n=1 Tax=Cinchona calisaya TaxID=153742 RepID=A0ABD2XYH0_9GENT